VEKVGSFRDVTIAPVDGRIVEVQHGVDQEIARAYWSNHLRAWIREDADKKRWVLKDVTGWRVVD
jgi:hypothetical protein